MPPSVKEQGKLPMLLIMLEHKKYNELIKTLFNQNMSKKLLSEYGQQKQSFSKIQQFKMNQDAQHFTIQDLIEIKGSNDKKVKWFQNTNLIETILRKIKANYKVFSHERKLFWLQFTQIYMSSNLYEGLAALELPPDTECILDKDVRRTYYNIPTSSNQQKQKATQILRKSIKQSLSHFALYNPYLLYCQGMNQIFGFLHEEGYSPKQMFFIFKRISEFLLPSDYYSSLDGLISYLKVLWQMVAVTYPKLHIKLNFLVQSMNLNGNYLCVFSYVLQWFVCLFTNSSLNRQIRRTIMDYFILEGITVLFKTCLAFFEYLEPIILSVSSFQSYVNKVQQAVKKYDKVAHLRKVLNTKFISKQILFLMKQYSATQKQESLKKFVPYTKKCSRKWNFCLQKLQNNMHEQHRYDFFVFKHKENVKIIPDYMNKLNSYYFQKKKNIKPVDLLKIGRIPHVCSHTSQTNTQDSLSENTKQQQSPATNQYSPSPSKHYWIEIKEPKLKQSKKDSQIVQTHQQPKQFTINEPLFEPTYQKDIISESYIAQNDDSIYHRKQTLEYRDMIKQKLLLETQKKTLQKSESMMFMKMMVDNQSYSNLFSLLQNQQMERMFDINSSDDDQESDSSGYNNATYGGMKK